MTDLVERPDPKYAAAFARMVDNIGRNSDDTFNGAIVIVPPEGEAIEMLMIDSKKDLAVFWSSVQTRIKVEIEKLQTAQQQNSGWGRR